MRGQHEQSATRSSRRRKKKKAIGVMDIILVIVGISLLAFTVEMIRTFHQYGAVPDTLVTCVFAALGGECGIMGWIKTNKDRSRERDWEKQDKREAQREAEKEEPPRNDL